MVTCDDGTAGLQRSHTLHGVQSYASDEVITPAVTVTQLNLELADEGPDVLLVLDPNGALCWEEVELDAFTNATLLHWLYQQHDVLTTSDHDSIGEPVQVSSKSQHWASSISHDDAECYGSTVFPVLQPLLAENTCASIMSAINPYSSTALVYIACPARRHASA